MSKYAVRYIRWSSNDQTHGDSLNRQSEQFTRFCQRHDLTPLPGYELPIDRGVSAYRGANLKRGSLGEFRQLVLSGQIPRGTTLVIEAQDRFSRATPIEAVKALDELVSAGIHIGYCFTDRIVDGDSLSLGLELMNIVMMASQAHEYSANLSKRLSASWVRKQKNAHVAKLTRTCPHWLEPTVEYDVRGRAYATGFVPIPEKVEMMRRIFVLACEGRGCHGITAALEAEGYAAPRGGRFSPAMIIRWIREKTVLGMYQPRQRQGKNNSVDRGDAVKDYYPAIVDEDTWKRANTLVASRVLRRYGRPADNDDKANVFQGLLVDESGRPYHIKIKYVGKESREYRILKSAYGRGGPRISYEKMVEAFLIYNREIDPHSFNRHIIDDTQALTERLAAIDGSIADLTARYKAKRQSFLVDLMEKEHAEREETRKALEELRDRQRNPTSHAVVALQEGTITDPIGYRARLRLAVSRIVLRVRELPFRGKALKVGDVAVFFRGGYIRLFTFIYRNSRGYLDSPLKLHQGFRVEGRKLGPFQETLDNLHRQVFFSEQLRQEIEAAGDSYPPDIDVDLEQWLQWARDNPQEAAELNAESYAEGWERVAEMEREGR
jgi:DNA invertase Pin-like site-specific DNA recombinase